MAKKRAKRARKPKKEIKKEEIIEEGSESPKEEKQPEHRICSDCGSRDIGHSGGEFYCNKCGLVIE